jgi:hypothetical protein
MIDKEFKIIDKVVWEISKRFLNTLEAENNNPNFEFFYTPPKSQSQHTSAKFESCMNENHGRRHSQILLDAHKAIVTQVVTARCACKCPSKTVRKSFEKTLCTQMPSTTVGGCEGLRVSIRRILSVLPI